MKPEDRLQKAQDIIGYTFKNSLLLETALMHPSAIEGNRVQQSYERLEFLGDSIMGAIMSYKLYLAYPDADEGRLTRLKAAVVSGASLTRVAKEAGLAPLIIFGGSEIGSDSRGLNSALEDVFEAITGALYLDGGYDAAYGWVMKHLEPILAQGITEVPENPKSILQEYAQRTRKVTPRYELIGSSGPAHLPSFTCAVYLDDMCCGTGEGRSKKLAEAVAAKQALERLNVMDAQEAGQHVS